ncbi:MAG TPA: nitroreductase family protein, partial [Candidatus Lokiarchaeia archaeon]|nr:nitroreductase family protein [Candidatus Lokiarchaeia archaeon]
QLAKCTASGIVIRKSAVCIAVFLNLAKIYNRTKDVQTMGACIENMLLAAHFHDLGACWLGEILAKRAQVEVILGVPSDQFELMAVLALGLPAETPKNRRRDPLDEIWHEDKFA